MQPIQEDILMQFNAVLKQKAVPSSLHDDYRKWLRHYTHYVPSRTIKEVASPLDF